jgi:hypothetical protein
MRKDDKEMTNKRVRQGMLGSEDLRIWDVVWWLCGCGCLVLAMLSRVRRSIRGADAAEVGAVAGAMTGTVGAVTSGIVTGIEMQEGGKAAGMLFGARVGGYAL